MNSLHQVDELVKEYLLFRGFTNSYRALDSESRGDKDKGFQVEKILEDLQSYITNSDVQKLIEYYRYLDLRFFSRLDNRFQRTVKKFELCLLRHYLVYAMQHKRRDKVIEFFDTYGAELYGKPEWSQWFALPYIKNPASDPAFETYFTKQWVDNYVVSLHNFLSTTFRHMPLPSLLSFNIDRVQRRAQQSEIENLKNQIEALKATAEVRENEIAKLKHEIAETRREVTDGISLIRRRAASLTREPRTNGSGDTRVQQTDKAAADIPSSAVSEDIGEIDEPFLLVSQDEYAEHASAITHAKFSSQENLIASCDMDNIVRIWSYKGQSMNPLKISNNTCNILSMEWEARSDRFLFLGTDVGTVRVYNVDSKSIVQEFQMENGYPWVNQISCSPVEPTLICAGSENKLAAKDRMGILVAWSMKSMAAIGSFRYHTNDDTPFADINTISLNHNGQMLVTGDNAGYMRIFDVRSMKSIMEWKNETGKPFCKAQFSFDETSIYSVDYSGQLSTWSVHKPGTKLRSDRMNGFPPPPAYAATSNIPTNEKGHLRKSSSTTTSANVPPRPTSNLSTSSISRLSVSSGRSNRLPTITFDDSVTQSLLSVSPRPEMVMFSADTEFCLCASWSPPQDKPAASSASSFDSSNVGTTQGSIYRVTDGKVSFQFGHQPAHQNLTAVDWTNSSSACLLGSTDGVIKVTNLIKV